MFSSVRDVVFLVDRHGCVARSMGKVSRGKFQNKILTKPEKLQALARLQEIYQGPTIQMDVESNPVRLLP